MNQEMKSPIREQKNLPKTQKSMYFDGLCLIIFWLLFILSSRNNTLAVMLMLLTLLLWISLRDTQTIKNSSLGKEINISLKIRRFVSLTATIGIAIFVYLDRNPVGALDSWYYFLQILVLILAIIGSLKLFIQKTEP